MGVIRQAVSKKFGKKVYNFTVEGENFFDVVFNSKKLSFGDVEKCGLCQSDNLELSAHIAEDQYNYVCVKCIACKGTLNFGQQKKNKDIWYLTTREEGENDKKIKVLDWKPFIKNE